MRLVADVQRMLVDRRAKLNGFEQFAGRTGKNRHAVCGWLKLGLEVARDALEVVVEARPVPGESAGYVSGSVPRTPFG